MNKENERLKYSRANRFTSISDYFKNGVSDFDSTDITYDIIVTCCEPYISGSEPDPDDLYTQYIYDHVNVLRVESSTQYAVCDWEGFVYEHYDTLYKFAVENWRKDVTKMNEDDFVYEWIRETNLWLAGYSYDSCYKELTEMLKADDDKPDCEKYKEFYEREIKPYLESTKNITINKNGCKIDNTTGELHLRFMTGSWVWLPEINLEPKTEYKIYEGNKPNTTVILDSEKNITYRIGAEIQRVLDYIAPSIENEVKKEPEPIELMAKTMNEDPNSAFTYLRDISGKLSKDEITDIAVELMYAISAQCEKQKHDDIIKYAAESIAERYHIELNNDDKQAASSDKPKTEKPDERLLSEDDCLANAIGGDTVYEKQLVILKPTSLAEEYRKADFQYFFATGGFGCHPNGGKVFGTFLCDFEDASFRRTDIIGIADPDKLPPYVKDQLDILLSDDTNNQGGGEGCPVLVLTPEHGRN